MDDKIPTKYILITLEYPPFKGGVGHYYFNLVKNWPPYAKATEGKPKEINPTPTLPFVRGGGIKVIDNSNNKLVDERRAFLKWWPAIKVLKSELKKDPDAALPSGTSGSHAERYILIGHLLPLGTVAWLASFIYKFKYCVFLHGYDLNVGWSQARKRWLIKSILKRADKIICANSYTEKQVRGILKGPIAPARLALRSIAGRSLQDDKSDKVALVNPGIEGGTIVYDEAKIEALKRRYNLAGKTVLLTVGRLTKRKGADMALEALNLAKNEAPELAFVIIGQGEEEANLRAKIADLGLGQNIHILTDVDDDEKMNWYKLCDIFIMTPRRIGADMEGFGIVYLEAGLAGKPVIAGASGGVADAVADNVNGLLVNPTDPEQIVEAIIKLAKYPNIRHRLGDAGRKRALEDFNWEKQAEKIYKHLTQNM